MRSFDGVERNIEMIGELFSKVVTMVMRKGIVS